METQLTRQTVNGVINSLRKESDLIRCEGDSKIYSLKQTHKGSLSFLSFSLPFQMPLTSHWPYHADLDAVSKQTDSAHTHRQTHLNVVSEEVASVFVLQLLCWQ